MCSGIFSESSRGCRRRSLERRCSRQHDNNSAAKAAAIKEKLMIPSGTILRVLLIDGLSTDTNSAGDHFLASLSESIVVDGSTIVPKGTIFRTCYSVEDSSRVKGVEHSPRTHRYYARQSDAGDYNQHFRGNGRLLDDARCGNYRRQRRSGSSHRRHCGRKERSRHRRDRR
jgi:hypothetical protein